jgi:hypothetical protein
MPCSNENLNVILTTKYSNETYKLDEGSAIVCSPQAYKHTVSAWINGTDGSYLTNPAPNTLDDGQNVDLFNGSLLLSWLDSTIPPEALALWPWWFERAGDTDSPDVPAFDPQETHISPWITLVQLAGNLSIEDTLNSSRLSFASTQVFEALFPYIATELYLHPSQATFLGNAEVSRKKLVALDGSLRLLQGIFVFLAIATAALYILHTKTGITGDPASLAYLATILSASPDFLNIVRWMGSADESRLANRLKDYMFGTRRTEDGRVELTVEHGSAEVRAYIDIGQPILIRVLTQ